MLQPSQWIGDARTGHLRLLDQTRLPGEVTYLDCRDVEAVWQAIKRLSVRGAPAIGIAAAYGCVIGAQQGDVQKAGAYLATSRPTAVNLFWAIDRMLKVTPKTPEPLLAEALKIHEEDQAMCQRIGLHTLALFEKIRSARPTAQKDQPLGVLTHCNAGALATGGIGTATAGLYLAHERGWKLKVFADETRPLLQGARLTALELQQAGIDVTLQCDNMAAVLMRSGKIQAVIIGADRIAANGDTANKIGTYTLAILARHHQVPFFVAAPSSTFDLSIPDGAHIPIEDRAAEEVTMGFGRRTAPENIKVFNPAFDVTPHELIRAIITEQGVIEPVNQEQVARVLRVTEGG